MDELIHCIETNRIVRKMIVDCEYIEVEHYFDARNAKEEIRRFCEAYWTGPNQNFAASKNYVFYAEREYANDLNSRERSDLGFLLYSGRFDLGVTLVRVNGTLHSFSGMRRVDPIFNKNAATLQNRFLSLPTLRPYHTAFGLKMQIDICESMPNINELYISFNDYNQKIVNKHYIAILKRRNDGPVSKLAAENIEKFSNLCPRFIHGIWQQSIEYIIRR